MGGGQCADCQKKEMGIGGRPLQTKLAISEPGDAYEQEADRMTVQVMRMSPADVRRREGNRTQPLVQRRASSGATGLTEAPLIVQEVLNSTGQPLDAQTRAFFEPRFGHDFSQVRVHTDAKAAESAQAVNAVAYTVGRDVVFAAGQYPHQTGDGGKILAHELTHVVQQKGARSPISHLRMGREDTTQEHEASKVASVIAESSSAKAEHSRQLSIAAGTISSQIQRFSESNSSGSGGGGGGGAAPVPGSGASCKIDVRATHIGGILRGAPIWHLFIVYTDSTGTEFYYRGGPGGTCPGVDGGSYGIIITNDGPYVPGTVDWGPAAPSVTVMSGASACGKDSCFTSELRRIDGTCTPYSPTGPNSNTVASTLLSNCGVPRRKPVWIAPGWGRPNI